MKCLQCKDKGFYLRVKYTGLDKVHATIYREEITVICGCPAGQNYEKLLDESSEPGWLNKMIEKYRQGVARDLL